MNACRALAAFLAATVAVPAAAQEPAPPPPSASSEILVLGGLSPDQLPTQAGRAPVLGAASRTMGNDAALFARCAGFPRLQSDTRLILDNGAENVLAQRALHKFILKNRGCYPGFPDPPPNAPQLGDCNPQVTGHYDPKTPSDDRGFICRNRYDRGALYERAIRQFEPDYELSREQTFNRLVRERFTRRQDARNHLTQSIDRTYFDTVACFVQISPQYGHALLAAEPGSAAETEARQYLIGYGSPCVGGAKTVKADPTQFRAYTAEVMYDWIASAKGVATLVR